jgi:hypothetical protein
MMSPSPIIQKPLLKMRGIMSLQGKSTGIL